MSKFDDLLAKLKEIFQMDQADLDFGIYRIMNVRRDEITRFLENDLLPTVRELLEKNKPAGLAEKEKELADAIAQARKLKIDPDTLDVVKELKAELAQGVDLEKMEQDVYSDLTNFFSRYYHEGDFISLRRYKEGLYAIPYEGEEVKLHWANADQYYIKSGENFSRYAFKTTKGRVRFELVSAATEQGDKKSASDKERCFILSEQTIFIENGDLVIPFEYRPDAEKRKQKELNTSCIEKLLSLEVVECVENWLEWRAALTVVEPTPTNKNRTLLEKQLTDYTKSNKSDYFIHKNLGKFLRNELDFYIKNEIMFLDDIDGSDAPKVESYLSRIKALRAVALKIITFLAQLENFQKKLWLKKKFVLESHYCITLDRIPENLYPQICEEAEIKVRVWSGDEKCQREEWVKLFAIDEIKADLANAGYSVPLTPDFLKSNPYLLVDTALFSSEFKYKLLAEIDNLDQQCDGLVVHSENFQALQLLQEKYRAQVKCIYIDPPYNTGDDGFVYKDSFKSSSWISMLHDRLKISKDFMLDGASIYCSIDNNEVANSKCLLSDIYGADNFVETFLWTRTSTPPSLSNKSRKTTEYVHCFENDLTKARYIGDLLENGDAPLLNTGNSYAELLFPAESIRFNISDGFYPAGSYDKVELIDDLVVYGRSNKNAIRIKGEFKWSQDFFDAEVRSGTTFLVKTIKFSIRFQRPDEGKTKPPTNFLEIQLNSRVAVGTNESANGELADLGFSGFSYAKPTTLIQKLYSFNSANSDWVLDYFAGSGTTANAVINLNRSDDGGRKYLLIEQNNYFDTVLLPRIQKNIYSSEWKNGFPTEKNGISQCVKYIRLESYEDTLNNLHDANPVTRQQADLISKEKEFRETYLLNYMLDFEVSSSLLDLSKFEDPFRLEMSLSRGDTANDVMVDMVETFNYLLGLTVASIRVKNGIHEVIGTTPQGDSALILWRNVKEIDNEKLDEWFRKQAYNTRDREFDLIYVNGDNNLENLRRSDETWKVRLIEEAFHTLMFDVQDV